MNTRIYFLDVETQANKKQICTWGSRLSAGRQEKIKGMRLQEDKLLSLGAGLLLDLGLSRWGLSEQTAAFVLGENGKPYLRDYPEYYFNLSHSGTRVMAAFSDHEVGCDIEQIKAGRLGVARRFFTKAEQAYLEEKAMSEDRRDREFTRLWALKESVLKVTGKGVALPLDSFEITLGESVHASLKEELSFREFQEADYQAAVCVKGGAEVLADVFFSFQKLQDVVR